MGKRDELCRYGVRRRRHHHLPERQGGGNLQKHGNLIGKNLYECHSEKSKEIIRHLLATGGSNAYTIEKQGVHKVIYQTAWKKDGKVAGIVEISMITPADMPHYVRG